MAELSRFGFLVYDTLTQHGISKINIMVTENSLEHIKTKS